MTRLHAALVTGLLTAVSAATISAGGWAVVTVESLPDRIEAGKAVPLTFMVRQHGITPLKGLRPHLEARSGAATVKADARAGASAGQYAADLALPQSGDWTITIHTGFMGSKLTLLPIAVVASGQPATDLAKGELGRRLFVAKGCVTCHAQERAMSVPALTIGPPLVARKYQDEFLSRVLADPAGNLPRGRTPVGEMPNLNLQPQEIAALVTFINHPMKEGTR